ncbi:MAG: antitoxin family protein [Armatimonadota bacterium]
MERRKARWGNGVLKLDKPLDLPKGTEVTVIVVPTFSSLRGILKHVRQDSVSLQHDVGKIWAEAIEEELRQHGH